VLHVTKSTYAELKELAKTSGRPLAVVVRSLTRPQRQGLSPEQFGLLRQLAGMATNLNQLAKRGHQDGFGAVADQVTQAAVQLSGLLDTFTSKAGADD
jgi:N6-adenosine-specific RNA methylase IME4